jgi:hypothetical protein
MGKTTFIICDEEKDYSEKLYEYIHAGESGRFDVLLFTDIGQLNEYLVSSKAGIILISDILKDELKTDDNNSVIVQLCHEKNKVIRGQRSVYKYSPAKEILKKVMDYCSESKTQILRRNCDKPLNVIGIYSPIKKAFQTTYAITLGQILATRGKTLYLNFESFSGFDCMMHSLKHPSNRSDLMDLMYFWQCGSENFSYRLSSITEKIGNLDYVPPVHSFMNYEGITSKQWTEFIKAFEEYTDYEFLILDLSEKINGLFDILRLCSRVYSVTDNRRISSAKMSQYETLLLECAYDDVIDKTKKISIPLFREIPESYEMLPYSDLAKYIKKNLEFEDERLKEAGDVM